jgi:hypothetical protein
MSDEEQFRFHILEEVGRRLESRGILRQGVQEVIRHTEKTGDKFIDFL